MWRRLLRRAMRRRGRHVPGEAPRLPFTNELPGFKSYEIGDYTYGVPRVLSWGEGATLKVGRYCSIAEEVTIFLGGEHRTDWVSTYPFATMLRLEAAIPGHPWTRGDVVIGNDVWIGLGATLRSGVRIGDGAVVGAGALVTADVAPYAVVTGNPARQVRRRFPDEVVRALLTLRWWDWPAAEVRGAIPFLTSGDVPALLEHARRRGLPADDAPRTLP